MSRNISEKALVFPGEIFKCPSCNQDNVYFVIIKPRGVVVWDGALCPHADKSKVGQKINRYEAAHFLRTEKREAEKNLQANGEVNGEKRGTLLQFISNVNNALRKMQVQAY